MFGSSQEGKAIGKGLKIVGSVTAEGLVQVNGQIDGELHCTLLVINRGAHVNGTVTAERVVVDGKVEGPIQGGEVVLKSQAHVVGDIHYQSLAIESGVFFDGRLVQVRGNGQTPEKLERKSVRQIANRESLSRRIERAVNRKPKSKERSRRCGHIGSSLALEVMDRYLSRRPCRTLIYGARPHAATAAGVFIGSGNISDTSVSEVCARARPGLKRKIARQTAARSPRSVAAKLRMQRSAKVRIGEILREADDERAPTEAEAPGVARQQISRSRRGQG